jgi:hypothetical protein
MAPGAPGRQTDRRAPRGGAPLPGPAGQGRYGQAGGVSATNEKNASNTFPA